MRVELLFSTNRSSSPSREFLHYHFQARPANYFPPLEQTEHPSTHDGRRSSSYPRSHLCSGLAFPLILPVKVRVEIFVQVRKMFLKFYSMILLCSMEVVRSWIVRQAPA